MATFEFVKRTVSMFKKRFVVRRTLMVKFGIYSFVHPYTDRKYES